MIEPAQSDDRGDLFRRMVEEADDEKRAALRKEYVERLCADARTAVYRSSAK